MSALECYCGQQFNTTNRVPKILKCGHRLCLFCCKRAYLPSGNILCPYDYKITNGIRPEDLETDFVLLSEIEKLPKIENIKQERPKQTEFPLIPNKAEYPYQSKPPSNDPEPWQYPKLQKSRSNKLRNRKANSSFTGQNQNEKSFGEVPFAEQLKELDEPQNKSFDPIPGVKQGNIQPDLTNLSNTMMEKPYSRLSNWSKVNNRMRSIDAETLKPKTERFDPEFELRQEDIDKLPHNVLDSYLDIHIDWHRFSNPVFRKDVLNKVRDKMNVYSQNQKYFNDTCQQVSQTMDELVEKFKYQLDRQRADKLQQLYENTRFVNVEFSEKIQICKKLMSKMDKMDKKEFEIAAPQILYVLNDPGDLQAKMFMNDDYYNFQQHILQLFQIQLVTMGNTKIKRRNVAEYKHLNDFNANIYSKVPVMDLNELLQDNKLHNYPALHQKYQFTYNQDIPLPEPPRVMQPQNNPQHVPRQESPMPLPPQQRKKEYPYPQPQQEQSQKVLRQEVGDRYEPPVPFSKNIPPVTYPQEMTRYMTVKRNSNRLVVYYLTENYFKTHIIPGQNSSGNLTYVEQLDNYRLIISGGHNEKRFTVFLIQNENIQIQDYQMLTSRGGHRTIYNGNDLVYIISGVDYFEQGIHERQLWINNCEIFNLTSKKFKQLAHIPIAVCGFCCVYTQEKIYVIGGKGHLNFVEQIQKYSCDSDRWEVDQIQFTPNPSYLQGVFVNQFNSILLYDCNITATYAFNFRELFSRQSKYQFIKAQKIQQHGKKYPGKGFSYCNGMAQGNFVYQFDVNNVLWKYDLTLSKWEIVEGSTSGYADKEEIEVRGNTAIFA